MIKSGVVGGSYVASKEALESIQKIRTEQGSKPSWVTKMYCRPKANKPSRQTIKRLIAQVSQQSKGRK